MKALHARALRKDLHGEPRRIAGRKPVIEVDVVATFCRKHKVTSFYLFGSILRDDFDENSDVDVMVDMGGRRLGFHETCGMLDELEAMFGRRVDMLTRHSIDSLGMNAHRRDSILSTARLLYEQEP